MSWWLSSRVAPHHLHSSALAARSGRRGVYGGGAPSYMRMRTVAGCHVVRTSVDFVLAARSLSALLRRERTQRSRVMPEVRTATKMIMPVMTRWCMPQEAS
jgi:hypothetical protein